MNGAIPEFWWFLQRLQTQSPMCTAIHHIVTHTCTVKNCHSRINRHPLHNFLHGQNCSRISCFYRRIESAVQRKWMKEGDPGKTQSLASATLKRKRKYWKEENEISILKNNGKEQRTETAWTSSVFWKIIMVDLWRFEMIIKSRLWKMWFKSI